MKIDRGRYRVFGQRKRGAECIAEHFKNVSATRFDRGAAD